MKNDKQDLTFAKLTKKQINTLDLFINPKISSITEIARRSEVSRGTIYNWLDDDNFQRALDKKIDQYVNSQTSAIWKSLIREAKNGDTRAIKLFFEMQGKYKDRKEITGKGGGAIKFEESAKEKVKSTIDSIAAREAEE